MKGTKLTTPTQAVSKEGLNTYVTNDPTIFSDLKENRELSTLHVKRLAEVVRADPHAFRNRPILVNEKMEVIDGQHRLAAAKETHTPIYFQVGNGLGIKDTLVINATQKNWSSYDFARAFASQGSEPYQKYLAYLAKYHYSHKETLLLMLGSDTRGRARRFKDGTLEIDREWSEIDTRFKQYGEIRRFTPDATGSNTFLVHAYLQIIKTPEYDHERMLRKIEMGAGKYLTHRFNDSKDALRALEDMYNLKAGEASRTRLF